MQAQNKAVTLKKLRSIISQVFRHALEVEAPGVVADWTTQLRGRQYSRPIPKHMAALTKPNEVGHLMKSILSYEEISLMTSLALRFSALTFARPGEIRQAEWNEIDWEHTLWRIPAEKMKMRQPHLVPLAEQTLEVLRRLQPITGHGRFLFPSSRSLEQPMSNATVLAAIRRMGFDKEQMSAHGFRGMASTILNERGWNRDWIERQLAHSEKNKVRAAYLHSDFLADRRKMIQAWADLLDKWASN